MAQTMSNIYKDAKWYEFLLPRCTLRKKYVSIFVPGELACVVIPDIAAMISNYHVVNEECCCTKMLDDFWNVMWTIPIDPQQYIPQGHMPNIIHAAQPIHFRVYVDGLSALRYYS